MTDQTEPELPLPAAPHAPLRPRPAFAGFSRVQILAGLLMLGLMIWGMWVTRELVKPRQDRIVAVRLSAIVGDYVQAQARSASPPAQVEAEMRKFMESLDTELAQRARKGEVVLVGEAVLTKNVPDITDSLRDAVYASGIARPRQASAAELQHLQDQAIAGAGQAAPPPAMMPMDYPGPLSPGDMQGPPGARGPQYGPPAPTVSTFDGSGGYAGQ
ncbi:type-F conjugative transfer system protein TrbI [Sphingopyxis macrogoltabida]|uniref:Type-F conjugative transfer system protein (TrbI_Ftype) n=1 Tax=Sphingopyxis macrogoltabida TaxID=33050 RepID=A0AAC9FHH6_SPHMC|nr:type-F conjugative transfer system protein TrbI [Sphingopyxis macrogoltabida]ALJ16283.1 hypothetical protein LH19_26135 [Sphingopyxis macrogoltabida]AMU92520.1 hypothetical protein ATM17_30135 [Sphingopyxis macrogoltabida]